MAKKPTKPKAEKKPKADKARAAKDAAARSKSGSKGTKKVKAAKKTPQEAGASMRMLPETELRSLAKKVQQAMDQSADAGGAAGKLISDAVKKGMNASAFRLAHRLLRQGNRNPAALREVLDQFDYMRDIFKLDDLAGDSMFPVADGGESEDESEAESTDLSSEDGDGEFSEGEGDGDNVHRLQRTGTDG